MPSSAISYVSLGDGSVNNAHFLAALNLAEYTQHRGYKCPVVFGISDNGLCISLKGHGWLPKFLASRAASLPLFVADGNDLGSVAEETKAAVEYSRKQGKPSLIHFTHLRRRFGHAATDRQTAYRCSSEIIADERANSLAGACHAAVQAGLFSYAELHELFEGINNTVEGAFDQASAEQKVDRASAMRFVSAPLVHFPFARSKIVKDPKSSSKARTRPQIMRKNMTAVLDELLANKPELVYIGEDVEHGGYYRITEGLKNKYPLRISDFPPDGAIVLKYALDDSWSLNKHP
eukprot:SAG31_NODE_3414_length_4302_cov_20.546239_5_plen_291_part_00